MGIAARFSFNFSTRASNYYDMTYEQNNVESYVNFTLTTELNNSKIDENDIHPIISLAYSGYKGIELAPWLTGLIFALVVFVILIPVCCSACYHYYW